MIKHKSGARKRKERVIRKRLQCKGQQRLESFDIVGRVSARKRSCEDAPDQETANEVLSVSESSLDNNIEVSNVNLVSNPSDAGDDTQSRNLSVNIVADKASLSSTNPSAHSLLTMELLLYAALVARLLIRTKGIHLGGMDTPNIFRGGKIIHLSHPILEEIVTRLL